MFYELRRLLPREEIANLAQTKQCCDHRAVIDHSFPKSHGPQVIVARGYLPGAQKISRTASHNTRESPDLGSRWATRRNDNSSDCWIVYFRGSGDSHPAGRSSLSAVRHVCLHPCCECSRSLSPAPPTTTPSCPASPQGSDGPPMVLIHGFGGNADHWRKNIPTLAKAGPVYAIDLLGESSVLARLLFLILVCSSEAVDSIVRAARTGCPFTRVGH